MNTGAKKYFEPDLTLIKTQHFEIGDRVAVNYHCPKSVFVSTKLSIKRGTVFAVNETKHTVGVQFECFKEWFDSRIYGDKWTVKKISGGLQ